VARDMELNALLRSDGRQLSLDLSAAVPVTDDSVILQFIHVTRAELDREVIMQHQADGRYYAALPELANGNWKLHLYPRAPSHPPTADFTLKNGDRNWEIRARLTLDGPFQTYLVSAR